MYLLDVLKVDSAVAYLNVSPHMERARGPDPGLRCGRGVSVEEGGSTKGQGVTGGWSLWGHRGQWWGGLGGSSGVEECVIR